MKLRHFAPTALAAVALIASALPTRAQVLVGTGGSSSYLVIEAPDFGSLFYQVFYDYNPALHLDSYFLLNLVTSADHSLSIDYNNYGDLNSPNYFINSITHSGTTLINTGSPTYSPFWYQSVSGGETTYPTLTPLASGSWLEGDGVSAHLIAPGSWDGFVFGDFGDEPSIAPVPEPATWLLATAGGIFLLLLRRRKIHA